MIKGSKSYFIVCLTAVFFLIFPVFGQDYLKDPKIIEAQLNELYGIEKLEALNILSHHYVQRDEKKATRYAKQSDDLADNLFNEVNELLLDSGSSIHGLDAYYTYGTILFNDSKLPAAKERFEKCESLAERSGQIDFEQKALEMLLKIDSIGVREGFFKRTLSPLGIGDKISNSSLDLKIGTTVKLARIQEKKKNYAKAIKHYEKAVNLMLNQGDAKSVADMRSKIAELNKKAGNYKEALAYFQITEDSYNKLGDTTAAKESQQALTEVFSEIKELAPEKSVKARPIQVGQILQEQSFANDSVQVELDRYKNLAEQYEQSNDLNKSIEYYKLYNELYEKRAKEEQDSIKLVSQAQEIRLLAKENELGDLQLSKSSIELERAASFRQWLTTGLIISALLLVIFYWLFRAKKKAHTELTITYSNLEETKGRLVTAEQKIKKLLGQQLSSNDVR